MRQGCEARESVQLDTNKARMNLFVCVTNRLVIVNSHFVVQAGKQKKKRKKRKERKRSLCLERYYVPNCIS